MTPKQLKALTVLSRRFDGVPTGPGQFARLMGYKASARSGQVAASVLRRLYKAGWVDYEFNGDNDDYWITGEGLTALKRGLLDRFQAKAGCMHTQEEATRVWKELKPRLHQYEMGQLAVAWGHHVDVKLGRGELDETCDEIRECWDNGNVLVAFRTSAPG
jgi:hypothetical protein